MKAMKCPECGEVSTFAHEWTGTVEFWAPLAVNDDGEIDTDYDNTDESGVDEEDCELNQCRCDNCNKIISIDSIQVIEEDVAAD